MILQINLSGKVDFAVNTPLNQIQNYILGGIIGGVIYNSSITIIQFMIILLIWSLIVMIIKYLRNQSLLFRQLVEGHPVILIHNGQLCVSNCIYVGLSADQLMAQLRTQGIDNIKQVKSALMEQTGHITILKNSKEDLHFPLITDGKVNIDVLEVLNHDENWLMKQLTCQGFAGVEKIFLAEYLDEELKITPYPTSH